MENKKDSIVICPGAQVLGDVELGENVSIWHGAVLRGDVASIKIGNNSNVQDNCVVHCSKDYPVVIKENVSVGHGAVIHGCTLEDNVLIGMNATVLNGAHIGKNSIVGAGAVVNFTINGKTITALTDDDGIAKFEINVVPGIYPVTTTYKNQTYKNKVTVVLDLSTCKVIDNKDITVDYNSDSYFTVRVVSADGKVAASDAPVTFKINGKTTTVKTDKNGFASFKLFLLNPGVYPIETIYNGISVINTVTVLADTNNNDNDNTIHIDMSAITNYNSKSNNVYTVYRSSDMKMICHSVVFNLKALHTTNTLERLIAPAAIIGFNTSPNL